MTRRNEPRVSALEAAALILGRRQLSKRELEKKLFEKGYEPEDMEAAVSRMEEIGALDDVAYGCMLARHYISRGWGPGRIKTEMFQRGVPREFWEEALESVGEFSSAAAAELEKKLAGSRDEEKIKKASAHLARRGFGQDDIRAAVRALDGEEK